MDSIKNKLEATLSEISLEKKKENNKLIDEDDFYTLFEELRSADKEVIPLIKIIELLLLNLDYSKYVLIEESIKEILNYYGLAGQDDLMNMRHKIFFEEGKIVKKRFFTKEQKEEVKNKISSILSKIGEK
jgi:hypothetical protein